MTSFDEALALLAGAVRPLPTESVPLEQAAGRFLAAPLHARSDAPSRAVSAMDGYAVTLENVEPDRWMSLAGESRPGLPDPGTLEPGTAMRIFTGAPLPAGADCVIMQEYAEREGGQVRFRSGFGPARHVRTAGSDFRAGDLLLATETRLTPRAMVAAASADRDTVEVSARPMIAIIATGDELAAPGTAHLKAGAIAESASYGVAAMCEAMGCEVVLRTRGADRLELLEDAAAKALEAADCVVVTGGASVGDHDLAKPMFGKAGLDLVFAGVAIKPGKPVWFGRANGRLVMGLPGNPTSAMVTARLFLRPLLAAMQGGNPTAELRFVPFPLAAPLPETGDRETFVRATATSEGLVPVGNQESGAQAPLAAADWLIRRPAGSPVCNKGALVEALPF